MKHRATKSPRPHRTIVGLMLGLVIACAGRLDVGPAVLPDARVGQPYLAPITVGGADTPVGGISAAEAALPPGLKLQFEAHTGTDDGRLAGTPERAGTYRFTVEVWCYGTNFPGQTASHEFTLVVR